MQYKIEKLIRRFSKTYETHNRIEISKSAILHNLGLFKNMVKLPAIPVIKGNAYGHGIKLVAKALSRSKVPYIAVDGYFEALRVREVCSCPVLIMGAIIPDNFSKIKYDNFSFVVQDVRAIQALGETGKKIKIHLEINTGMNRYGIRKEDLKEVLGQVSKYKNLVLEGVMSHLADSDNNIQATVSVAVDLFDLCIERIRDMGFNPSIIHIAQTAGSVRARSKYANAFRLGIGLYGINPFPTGHKNKDDLKNLKPALKVVSTITKVIELNKGDKVSYNYTYTAGKKIKIGVFPFGYYEGLNRELSNRGKIMVKGKEAPIVGRICMNHSMVSLEGIDAEYGDEVVVYSNNPKDVNSIENISRQYSLFNYGLLTSLNQDVRRILVD